MPTNTLSTKIVSQTTGSLTGCLLRRSRLARPASRLYAQNIVNLVTLMTAKSEDGHSFAPDFDDEIVAGCCVTHGREVRHEPTRAALEGPPVEPVGRPVESVGRPVEPVETEGDTP